MAKYRAWYSFRSSQCSSVLEENGCLMEHTCEKRVTGPVSHVKSDIKWLLKGASTLDVDPKIHWCFSKFQVSQSGDECCPQRVSQFHYSTDSKQLLVPTRGRKSMPDFFVRVNRQNVRCTADCSLWGHFDTSQMALKGIKGPQWGPQKGIGNQCVLWVYIYVSAHKSGGRKEAELSLFRCIRHVSGRLTWRSPDRPHAHLRRMLGGGVCVRVGSGPVPDSVLL